MIGDFFRKMAGTTRARPGSAGAKSLGPGWGASWHRVGGLPQRQPGKDDLILLIGSFGASAVLIYGAIISPLAQPGTWWGGHLISAAIGVTVYQWFSPYPGWPRAWPWPPASP